MRKFILATVAALALGSAGAANATVFGGTASFVDTNNNAINVWASPNPYSFQTSSLKAGESYTFSSFMQVNVQAAKQGSNRVALNIDWTKPSDAADSTQGGNVAVEFSYFLWFLVDESGTLKWDGATHDDHNGLGPYAEQLVTFNNGAQAYLDVYNSVLDLNCGDTLTSSFAVRVKDVRDPVSVPEPMSMALVGTGLLGLGLVRRRAG